MIVETGSEAEWQELIRTSPHASAFVMPWFINALGNRCEYHLVKDGNSVLAGCPVLLDGASALEGLPPFSMYFGPLLAGPIAAEPPHRRLPVVLRAVETLLDALTARYETLTFSMHYDWDDLRAFSWHHYHQPQRGRFAMTQYYTGILPLSDVTGDGSWLRSIRTSRRQDAEKAKKNGLICELSDDIDLLSRIYLATFERQNMTVDDPTMQAMQSIARAAITGGTGFINVCRDPAGAVLSANLIVFDHRSAYYLVGANDPAGRSTGAGTYVLADSIQRAKAGGLAYFDFVGINSPRRGDFKTSFNARPRLYVDANWRRPQ